MRYVPLFFFYFTSILLIRIVQAQARLVVLYPSPPGVEMDALFFSLLVHTPPLRRPSSLLFPSLFKTPLSLSLSFSHIPFNHVCMYVCMHVLNRISQLFALLFILSATGKGSAKKRKLPWRRSWFPVRLKLKLKMEHDQLIKTTRLIRTRTFDQPFSI